MYIHIPYGTLTFVISVQKHSVRRRRPSSSMVWCEVKCEDISPSRLSRSHPRSTLGRPTSRSPYCNMFWNWLGVV